MHIPIAKHSKQIEFPDSNLHRVKTLLVVMALSKINNSVLDRKQYNLDLPDARTLYDLSSNAAMLNIIP